MRHKVNWGLAGVLLLTIIADAAVAVDSIEGVWVTGDGDGLVKLEYRGEQLTGHISGTLSDPDHDEPPRYDILNPEPELRSRALLGLEIFSKEYRYWGGPKHGLANS